MNSQRELNVAVDAYVAAVDQVCADLPAETRSPLRAELQEHLLELAREGLDFAAELGTPAEYAAEWRAAAELPPATPRPKRRRTAMLLAGVVIGCLVGAGIVARLNRQQELTPELLYARYAAIVNGQLPGHKGIPIHANARPTGEVGADGTWRNKTTHDTGAVDLPASQYVIQITCAGHGYLQGSIQLGSTTQQISPVDCTRYGVTRLTFITLTTPARDYAIDITPLSNKIAAFAFSVTEYMPNFTAISSPGTDVRMNLGAWTGTGDGIINLSLPESTKQLTLRMTCDRGNFEVRNSQLGLIYGGNCAADASSAATGTLALVGTRLVIDVGPQAIWKLNVTALL